MRALITFLILLFAFTNLGIAAPNLELSCGTNQIGKYEKIEFQIAVSAQYANPFNPDEVGLDLQFTTPSGQKILLPAYFGQDYERRPIGNRDWFYPKGVPVWKARFAPAETGSYKVTAILKDSSGTVTSQPISFTCVPSAGKGFVRVSQKDPRFLEFTEGQPFFPIGENLAFIGNQQYVTVSKAEKIFAQLQTNGANYLRIWGCCDDWAMAIEARKSAWGRSWDWRPPFAPMPGAANTNTKCLKLSGDGKTLSINPSHPLTIKPSTKYVFTGRLLTEPNTSIKLDLPRSNAQTEFASKDGAWADLRYEFQTGPQDFWLERMAVRLQGSGSAYIADLSLREAAGSSELLWEAALNRPVRGYYNPLDSYMLDKLFASAEQHGQNLQLCLLARDLYMNAMKEPQSAEYAQAVADAKKTFRYAVARWGYSTSLAAWEYWNEQNPGLPCDKFYAALGEYLEQIDPYHHLRTTSTWGPCARDCKEVKLDFADVHFYLRPADKNRLRDEVEAALDRARWLREQAPNKPAHLGEFGLANDKWQPTDEMNKSRELIDFHNGLWASALSGTTGSALFWWWDRFDRLNVYPQYRPLSTFIADVPWNSGEVQSLSITNQSLRVVGLKAGSKAWLWLFNPAAAWAHAVVEQKTPEPIQNAQIEVPTWPAGAWRIQWFDTTSGAILQEDKAITQNGILHLAAPSFSRDMACKILPQ